MRNEERDFFFRRNEREGLMVDEIADTLVYVFNFISECYTFAHVVLPPPRNGEINGLPPERQLRSVVGILINH